MWDLTRAVFYHMGKDQVFYATLLGNWKNDSGYYLNFYEKEPGNIWISTNLPNHKNEQNEYVFYYKDYVIGYSQIDNSENTTLDYRIIDINAYKVTIYCYKSSSYYTLLKTS